MHLIAAMQIAGAEKVVLNQVRAGCSDGGLMGFDQRVTSFVRVSDGAGIDFLREVASTGAQTDRIAITKRFDLGDISALWRIIKRHNVGLLHTHGYRSDIAGVVAAKLSRIPIVITAHGFAGIDTRLNRNERMGRWFMRYAQKIIAVSDNVRQTLIEAGIPEHKIVLIPNAIDFDQFAQACAHHFRREWDVKPDEIVIGTVGRLSPEKAQANLIRMVALLPEELRSRLTVVIAGEGSTEADLRQTAAEMNLTGRVILAGFVRDVHSFYHALDLFCLPSITEGHPLTVMEAAACGVPVVASRVGAIRQLITDGVDGYTPEPGDIPQLAKAIESALSQPDLGKRMGRNLRDKLHREYDIGPWAARVSGVYNELVKN
jgi:glycosyltransferase involved in cell wall biosynthesis